MPRRCTGYSCRASRSAPNAPTAELVKLVENAYRDVNIAFANELSLICDQLGLNVWQVIELANRHPRVAILQPGAGVGGHCIAVDPWFIISSAPERSRLIRTAREVNDAKPGFVAAQIRERAERFKHPVVACLGLTYKPDVDDLRESPAVAIVAQLARGGPERILVADPNLRALPPELAELLERLAVRHDRGGSPSRYRRDSGRAFAISQDPAGGTAAPRRHRCDRPDPRSADDGPG